MCHLKESSTTETFEKLRVDISGSWWMFCSVPNVWSISVTTYLRKCAPTHHLCWDSQLDSCLKKWLLKAWYMSFYWEQKIQSETCHKAKPVNGNWYREFHGPHVVPRVSIGVILLCSSFALSHSIIKGHGWSRTWLYRETDHY